MSAARAETGAVDPASITEATKRVVVVLPRWQGVRPGFAPRTSGRRIAPEGSGIAILPDGYIATNDHVLGDPLSVRVRLHDGRVLPTEIVGRHADTDIALLKVAADLPVFDPAPETRLATPACAIGNPFGQGISVSCGVISGTDRSATGFNPIEDFIQTDAAVNPGGSGGALVDGAGRLLGMVSAIFAQGSDANLGVNFAASYRLVRRVVDDLKAHGAIRLGDIGLAVQTLPPDQAARGGGVLVRQVDRGGPALAAGIEAGDVIIAVDGRSVSTPASFRAAAFLARPGDRITLTSHREGKTREADVLVAPGP